MKAQYDSTANAFYLSLSSEVVTKTVEISDSCLVDYGENGSVVGVEILGLNTVLQDNILSIPVERVKNFSFA